MFNQEKKKKFEFKFILFIARQWRVRFMMYLLVLYSFSVVYFILSSTEWAPQLW